MTTSGIAIEEQTKATSRLTACDQRIFLSSSTFVARINCRLHQGGFETYSNCW